jgi:hypothetical protein
VYPFRAAQVLQLLNSIDGALADAGAMARRAAASESPSVSTPVNTPASAPALATTLSEPNPWLFVQTLRTLREVENASVWLTARLKQTPVIWVKGDGREYCTDVNTLQAIRQGTLVLSTLALRKGSAPESHRTMRPSTELEWFAGFHASDQLAPWLDAKARFRITRWPNFGLIRPLPSQIRLAALLGAKALTIDDLISRVKVTRPEVVRTLNALDACGLLAAVTLPNARSASDAGAKPGSGVAAASNGSISGIGSGADAGARAGSASARATATTEESGSAATPQPSGGVRNLLRLMRKRLGLSDI